jgi:hypothetical protein
MKRAFLLIALLVIATWVKFHHEKRNKKFKKFKQDKKVNKKDGFRKNLYKLRHFTQKEFKKWQKALLYDQPESNEITNRQAKIAKKLTKWKLHGKPLYTKEIINHY